MACTACYDLALYQNIVIEFAKVYANKTPSSCDTCQLLCAITEHFGFKTYLARLEVETRHDGPHSLLLLEPQNNNYPESIEIYWDSSYGSSPFTAFPSIPPLIRPAAQHSFSEESFSRARSWLQDCVERHPTCPKNSQTTLPSRVIDVGLGEKKQPFLSDMSPALGRFAALSYCWGTSDQIKLTSSNLVSFKEKLPMERLSQTAADAIFICQRLSIANLWIDALCILQDDREDWVTESSKMCSTYSNAALTIVAASSTDCSQGIFSTQRHGLKDLRVQFRDGIVYARRQGRKDHVGRPLAAHLNRETLGAWAFTTRWEGSESETLSWVLRPDVFPLAQRAWTVQERIMSNRALYYTSEEMWWECNYKSECECGWSNFISSTNQTDEVDFKYGAFYVMLRNPGSAEGSTTIGLREIYLNWARTVTVFTAGSLSRSNDKLPAISGLARQYQNLIRAQEHRQDGDDVYLSGLWKANLEASFLWFSQDGSEPFAAAPDYWRAPTWSWASRDGMVAFHEPCCCESEFVMRILKASAEISTSDEFGCISAGRIVVEGPLSNTILFSVEKNFEDGYLTKTIFAPDLKRPQLLIRFSTKRFWRDNGVSMYEGMPCVCLAVSVSYSKRPKYDKSNVVFLALKPSTNSPGKYERIGLGIGRFKWPTRRSLFWKTQRITII